MGSSSTREAAEEVRKSIEWVTHVGHLMTVSGRKREEEMLAVVEKVLNSLTTAVEVLCRCEDGRVVGESPGSPTSNYLEVGEVELRGKAKGSVRPNKKGGPRKRSHPGSTTTLSPTLKDGYPWRKYGQKEIQGFLHPRSYYRCTHKFTKGCSASRTAQPTNSDQNTYTITYIGHHTCMATSGVIDTQPASSSSPQSELTASPEMKMEDCEEADQAIMDKDDIGWSELDMLPTTSRSYDEITVPLYGSYEHFEMWDDFGITSNFLDAE